MINIKYILLMGILCLAFNCRNDSGKGGKTTDNMLAKKNDSSKMLASKTKPRCNQVYKQDNDLPLINLSENLSKGNISNESYLDNTSPNVTNESYSNERSPQKKNRQDGYLTDELCEAIKNNDLKLVQSLLDAGADLNNNAEALHTAIVNNNPIITQLLLKAGADPNIPDENGYYPLDAAMIENSTELVTLLLKAGAHIRFFGTRNYATCYNLIDIDISILEILLIRIGCCGKKDYEGLSPLHWAAKDSYTGVIRALVDGGQSLNYDEVDPVYNFTPLHYAARKGNKAIVEMLLAQGANRTAVSKSGFTPLMLAIANGHKDLIPLLSPDEFNRSALEPSGKSLDISSKNCAICHVPFDPNDGTKPIVVLPCNIHHRFHSKCIDHRTSCPICREIFVDYNKYSNIIKDHDYYQSLLIDSIQNCNKEAFDESLKYGIDPNIPDKNGRAPLALVGFYTHKSESARTTKDMMIALIKHGAYIGNKDVKIYFPERYHDILEEAIAFDESYAGRRSFSIPLDRELFCESTTHKDSDGRRLRSHG